MNALIGPVAVHRWLADAGSLVAIAFIGCATESGGDAGAPATDDAAAEHQDGDPAGVTGTTPGGTGGGISEDCVRQVLGRDASGFGDVTSAERDRILSECSGDDRARAGASRRGFLGEGTTTRTPGDFQFGGGGFTANDRECVQRLLGDAAGTDGTQGGFTQITPDQRQGIFEECGGDELTGGGVGPGDGFSGRDGGRDGPSGEGEFRGGVFGRDGGLGECATAALGANPEGPGEPGQLTPEEFQAIVEACGDELFGEGFRGGLFGQVGGPGGFSGGFRDDSVPQPGSP